MASRAKGSGSVYQRGDGKWVAQVDNGFTASGRRRYLRRVRPNRKQAVQALGELERITSRALDSATSRATLAVYLDRWLDDLAGSRAEKTLAAYRADVAHVVAVIGSVRLDKLAPSHVRQLLAALPDRGLAPKSALNVRTTLHTAVEQAVKDRVIDWNPVSVVDRPRVPRYDADALTVDQARAVLAALADDRVAALYTVAVAIGLRLGEALGLTWARLDLDAGLVQVRHQMRRTTHRDGTRHYHLTDLKNRRIRDVPLPDVAVSALARHKRTQAEERLANADRWVDGCCKACGFTGAGLVFTTCSTVSAGRPLHETQARKRFQDVCESTIGYRPRIHDLRHTAATLLLAQGVQLPVVQQILGHSSIQVTKDVYGHLEAEHLRPGVGRMDELLG